MSEATSQLSSACVPDSFRDFSLHPFSIVARGEAAEPDMSLFDRKVITTVRYADPAAWTIATAVHNAFSTIRETIESSAECVGIIGICEHGPEEATAAINQAATEGFPSPMRYPAANPGSVVGVSCIAFGLRGPTSCLLMAPADGVKVAMLVAGQWLGRGAARYVVVATCCRKVTRAAVLAAEGQTCMSRADGEAWLACP